MRSKSVSFIRGACIIVTVLAVYFSATVLLPAQAGQPEPRMESNALPETRASSSRGYLTTPEELKVIAQKAAQGTQPYASAVNAVISAANSNWSYTLSSEARCGGAGDPAWADASGGTRVLYAKALAYHLTGNQRYASEVRTILESIMTKVLKISTSDAQCGLNFGWATPELVAAADLIEDYWKGQTCTGPLGTSYSDTRIGSGQCKTLFQNWLVKNPYYVVSYVSEKSLNNWGAAATTATAYVADYLWDRSDVKLVHRNPPQVNGGANVSYTPAQAYARANQLAITRMNGYRTDYHGSTSCDYLSGTQQSSSWKPVKSQITANGIVPDDARREQYCNIPSYNGSYQNYPQVHLGNNIQQCELMLRRGDRSCFNNIDQTGIANYTFTDPKGNRLTTSLSPGRGSIERAINAVIVDSGTTWNHDSALAVAYRYYSSNSRFGQTAKWAPQIDKPADCVADVCFGVLTHGLARGETATAPPTVPPPGSGALPPASATTPAPTATLAPTQTQAPTKTAAPTQTQVASQPTVAPTTVSQSGSGRAFAASDDALVRSGNPSGNYGSLDYLRARLDGEEYRSYLKFTVSGLGGSATRATLRLYSYDGSPDGGTVYQAPNTYRSSSTPWAEGGLNWNNAPPLGTSLASVGHVNDNAWVEFDVTRVITGDGTFSFVLANKHSNSVFYFSRQAANYRPELVIETGTSPSSSVLQPVAPTATSAAPPPIAPTATPLSVSGPGTGEVVSYVLAPSDDALVRSENPDRNYGAEAYLRTRLDGSADYDSYLKFTVPTLNGTVIRASLRLFSYDGSPDAGALYHVANTTRSGSEPWSERAITWNTAPPLGGAPLAAAGAVPDNTWAVFDVTRAVTGPGSYSFALSSQSSNSAYFYSKDATSYRPQLVVEVQSAGGVALAAPMQAMSLSMEEASEPMQGLPRGDDDLALDEGEPVEALDLVPAETLALELESAAPGQVELTPTPILEAPPATIEVIVDEPAPLQPLPAPVEAGQLIESDSAMVVASGTWTAHESPLASGGRYIFSDGSPADTLTLAFVGASVEVVFVQHPALGSFVMEVDGAPLQTVLTTAPESVFGARVALDLGPGEHILRVVPVEGTVAIDAFVIDAQPPSVPEAPAPDAPAPDAPAPEQPAPEQPAPADPLPTVDVPAPPELTPVPTQPVLVALGLPVYEPFAGPDSWQPTQDWIFFPQGGYQGSAWFAEGRSRNDTSTLTAGQPILLNGVAQPELRFWQKATVTETDVFAAEISTDAGVTWYPLLRQIGQSWSEWQLQVVDLTPYNGLTVWLRFVFVSTPGAVRSEGQHGVWIDELTIAQAQPLPAPTPLPAPIEVAPVAPPPAPVEQPPAPVEAAPPPAEAAPQEPAPAEIAPQEPAPEAPAADAAPAEQDSKKGGGRK